MSAVSVLTDQQIQQELEAESSVRILYNPSNRWLEGRVAAQPYPLCPDGEALNVRTGKVETTNGETKIKDFWDSEWTSLDGGRRTRTGGRVMITSSLDAVKHLTKMFPFIARLTGDAKKDAKIKADAQNRWVAHRVSWATEVIAGRDEKLRAFRAEPSNAGRIPDPMNPIEIEAYEFMDQYHLGTIGRKAFVCRHDGYQTDEQEKWDTHVNARHSGDASALTTPDKPKGKKKD